MNQLESVFLNQTKIDNNVFEVSSNINLQFKATPV